MNTSRGEQLSLNSKEEVFSKEFIALDAVQEFAKGWASEEVNKAIICNFCCAKTLYDSYYSDCGMVSTHRN